MNMDKKAVREALEWYRQWNEAKEEERARLAASLTPQELWEQYHSLWKLLVKSAPPRSLRLLRHRLTEIDDYYDKVREFEKRRRQNGSVA